MANPILVPVDLNQESVMDSLFAAATDYADTHDAAIDLLTVLPDLETVLYPYIDPPVIDHIVADAQRRLEDLGSQRLGKARQWQARAVTGRVAPTIIQTADDLDVSLIVIASHNPLFSDVLFGSVATQVVKHANHSVLIVRQRKKRA